MSMSLKRYIVQTDEYEDSEDLEFREDEKHLYFECTFLDNDYSFIYNKDKDICMMLKNRKPISSEKLNTEETALFDDLRITAINYHHDRDVMFLN